MSRRDRTARPVTCAGSRPCARRVLLAGVVLALSAVSAAGEPEPGIGEVVVTASPLPGTALDADKVPANLTTLDSADLARDGETSLTRALAARLGSISIDDNLNDAFQPDIYYRGFAASPVLGTPQGLAVYQNGVRINEAFGDVVNWDLIPDLAIERVELVAANPVYGLNALGGGLSVTMKNGFSYAGSTGELGVGSFAKHALSGEAGGNDGRYGIYVATRLLDQDGWRRFGSDSVRELYLALSARPGPWALDLSYAGADNRLNGQGAAPVQELAVDRTLTFTGPQSSSNRLNFVTLNASLALSPNRALQALVYYRDYQQRIANGNTTNYTTCTNATGLLCQPDGLTPLTGLDGRPIPDLSHNGTQPIGENDAEQIGAYGRGGALQFNAAGRLGDYANQFTAGAALDYARVAFGSVAELGAIDAALLVTPGGPTVATPEGSAFAATPVALRSNTTYYGLYATDTLDVAHATAVTASVRYNHAEVDLYDLRGSALTGNNRFSHLNPALGLTRELDAGLTVYGGVAQTTRSPTASEIECANPSQPCLLPSNLASDPPTLRQVVATTYEAGLRSLRRGAGDGLHGSLGVFRTDLRDDIYGVATSLSSGYFTNIGSTRRQGLEAALDYRAGRWSAFANWALIDATFRSAFAESSPQNPKAPPDGLLSVVPGDRLPGIPRQRLKLGADYHWAERLTLGLSLQASSSRYFHGDESNQNAPLAGFSVVGLHALWRPAPHVALSLSLQNLLDRRYSTYGIFGDPTGVGAPGIPAGAVTNGPGVDNRFESPVAPMAAYLGVRLSL